MLTSFCEFNLILWGHSHYVRMAWSCEDSLNLWGQTAFFESRPHYVWTDLFLWGQTSFCEAMPHSVRQSICEAGFIFIPLQTALLFQKIAALPRKSGSASDLCLNVLAVYVSLQMVPKSTIRPKWYQTVPNALFLHSLYESYTFTTKML